MTEYMRVLTPKSSYRHPPNVLQLEPTLDAYAGGGYLVLWGLSRKSGSRRFSESWGLFLVLMIQYIIGESVIDYHTDGGWEH